MRTMVANVYFLRVTLWSNWSMVMPESLLRSTKNRAFFLPGCWFIAWVCDGRVCNMQNEWGPALDLRVWAAPRARACISLVSKTNIMTVFLEVVTSCALLLPLQPSHPWRAVLRGAVSIEAVSSYRNAGLHGVVILVNPQTVGSHHKPWNV